MAQLAPAFALPPLTSTEPVFCQECEQWFEPDSLWRCPLCNEVAAYAVQPGTCPRCGKLSKMLRDGNRLRSLCHCHLSPAERAALEKRWRELDDEDNVPPLRARPGLAEASLEVRDWWPDLRDLVPLHLDDGLLKEHILDLAEQGWSLRQMTVAMRTILSRIRDKKTQVGSMGYLFKALETERNFGRVSRRKGVTL